MQKRKKYMGLGDNVPGLPAGFLPNQSHERCECAER